MATELTLAVVNDAIECYPTELATKPPTATTAAVPDKHALKASCSERAHPVAATACAACATCAAYASATTQLATSSSRLAAAYETASSGLGSPAQPAIPGVSCLAANGACRMAVFSITSEVDGSVANLQSERSSAQLECGFSFWIYEKQLELGQRRSNQ